MLQTVFYIPETVPGTSIPVFGFGLLLGLIALASLLLLGWLTWRQGLCADTFGYVPLLAVLAAIVWFVLPYIVEPGKGLPIRGYGTMLLAAVLAGTGLTVWRGRRLGLDPDRLLMLCFWMIVPGILGARIFYIVQYWEEEFRQPTLGATLAEMVNFTQGGLVVLGSVIGGLVGMFIFVMRNKMPLLATCDLLAPGFMIGLTLGRIGCFLNGCCFGGPCELPWAVQFPAGSPAHIHQVHCGEAFLQGLRFDEDAPGVVIAEVEPGSAAARTGLAAGDRVASIGEYAIATPRDAEWVLHQLAESEQPVMAVLADGTRVEWAVEAHGHSNSVHPTQIYSAINAAVLCLLLLAFEPFRRRDGEVFLLFFTMYPITRFLLEIIRTDEAARFGTGMTISQNLSLAMLLLAVAGWAVLLRQPKGTAFPKYEPAGSA